MHAITNDDVRTDGSFTTEPRFDPFASDTPDLFDLTNEVFPDDLHAIRNRTTYQG